MYTDAYATLKLAYPPAIRSHLDAIFAETLEVLGPGRIVSLLLVGSAGRAELSFTSTSAGLDLFSDYEFVVVTSGRTPRVLLDDLRRRLASLADSFDIRSPLFAIDFGVSSLRKWRWTAPTLWAYEVSEGGVTVWGSDVRDQLPRVTLRTLDFGHLNGLVLVRLWNLLLHLPRRCLDGSATDYERFTADFLYARNLLELLTIYLPHRGILVPGYAARLAAFETLHDTIFGGAERAAIRAATDLKLNRGKRVGGTGLRESLLPAYIELLAFVAGVERWDGAPDSLAEFVSSVAERHPFDDSVMKKARRATNELRWFRRLSAGRVDAERIRWLFSDKRYPVLGTLIALHAVLTGKYAIGEQRRFIELASRYLEQATASAVVIESEGIPDAVDQLRKGLLRFMMDWLYGHRPVLEHDMLRAMDYAESP